MVAEKLLQQTAVNEKVVTAYEEIISQYPTVESLARALPSDLKRIILPLGFSYRADELPRLAQAIIDREQENKIPDKLEELLSLPGIGDYAARAILSFSYNAEVPIVDTNIARLLHRIFGIEEPLPSNPARNKRLIQIATALLPMGRARDFNLACLDLCAAICTVRQPKCTYCPIQRSCRYGRTALTQRPAEGDCAAA
jgi:A/G-specific adenine glycosylase